MSSLCLTNFYECFQFSQNCKPLIKINCFRYQAGTWRLLITLLLYREENWVGSICIDDVSGCCGLSVSSPQEFMETELMNSCVDDSWAWGHWEIIRATGVVGPLQ